MIRDKRVLGETERLDWLRLIRTENVGPVTFRDLMRRFGGAAAALDALPVLSRRGGRAKPLRPMPRAAAERERDALARMGGRLIAWCEPDYPDALAAAEDAPPVLSVRGHAHLLGRPVVGMVGARNASANGRRFAAQLAGELGQAGLVVASGLARGIDAAAHEGALATGTVAALAGGVDIAYPPENAALQDSIAEAGALIAESPLGTRPTARHFPRRNRLIAGLSLGVVVVEAAPRSGSLITARMAGEYGREVFAVPGSPLDPRTRGCNELIRSGATLVQSASDILEGLPAAPPPVAEPVHGDYGGPEAGPEPDAATLAEARRLVEERLSPTPTPVDELIRDCQLSLPVVLTVLLELELAGRIERQPGNSISLL
ncbi:MAG: DNA-processing protein DprA [Azospirillaceae bacterium]